MYVFPRITNIAVGNKCEAVKYSKLNYIHGNFYFVAEIATVVVAAIVVGCCCFLTGVYLFVCVICFCFSVQVCQ